MPEIKSSLDGQGLRIGVAVARFNEPVTEMLLTGCLDALRAQGVAAEHIELVRVPGAFELPLACQRLAARADADAVIALGAVIRGQTAHFDYICAECTRGLMEVMREFDLPVAFGVLTTENGEQAMDRADPKRKNKGREAAMAALEMANLMRVLR